MSGFFPMQVNGGVGRLTVGARVVPIKASEEFFRRVEMRTKGVVGSILKMGKDDATASLDVERESRRHGASEKDAFIQRDVAQLTLYFR